MNRSDFCIAWTIGLLLLAASHGCAGDGVSRLFGGPTTGSAAPNPVVKPSSQDEAYGHFSSANLYILDATAFEAEGQPSRSESAWSFAIRELETAARLDPASPAVQRLLAGCYMRLRMPEKATRALDMLSRLTPDTPGERLELARAFRSLGRNTEAATEYEKSIQLATPGAEDWRKATTELAGLYQSTGNAEKALPLFRSLIDKFPGDDALRLTYITALADS